MCWVRGPSASAGMALVRGSGTNQGTVTLSVADRESGASRPRFGRDSVTFNVTVPSTPVAPPS